MKILRTLLLLATGFILGWAVANTISHRNWEKFKSAWDPARKNAFEESVTFQKSLTKDDMEQLRQDIRDYKQHAVSEIQIRTLWEGILAIQIQRALDAGNTDLVNKVLAPPISRLKEKHAEGGFKGTDYEKLADSWSGVTVPATEEPQ